MRHDLFLVAVLACANVAAFSDPSIPSNWGEFQLSMKAEDKKLVAQIEKRKWWENCESFGKAIRASAGSRRTHALREYLLSERLINGVDLMYVKERKIAVGMSACGVYASLGMPDAENRSEYSTRRTSQMVFRRLGVYVYTDAQPGNGNGIVRSFQH